MADISRMTLLDGTVVNFKDAAARADLQNKADKSDTVLLTTLSRDRRSNTTVGSGSIAFGEQTTASGATSAAFGRYTQATNTSSFAEGSFSEASGHSAHAEGLYTVASNQGTHAEGDHAKATNTAAHAEGKNTTSSGTASHAEGYYTLAKEDYSHAEGYETQAKEDCAHAEGYYSQAVAINSHAEGRYTYASGNNSHAEGDTAYASGASSHVEGCGTLAYGYTSHAEGTGGSFMSGITSYTSGAYAESSHSEGYKTYSAGTGSHSEGGQTLAMTNYAHAEGFNTQALGYNGAHAEGSGSIAAQDSTHAEGSGTQALEDAAHSEGTSTIASGVSSHAEGGHTIASGTSSHSEGADTTASSSGSHAEGGGTTASGICSHAEGSGSTASERAAHAEGSSTTASGDSAHAEGSGTRATNIGAHAEGGGTQASYPFSHAEGSGSTASGYGAHAEGNGTIASGQGAHAEGGGAQAIGGNSHAEGSGTRTLGAYSHAEGGGTTASGNCAHAEGGATTASGFSSHAEGNGTIAVGATSHVGGKNNIGDSYDDVNWPEWVSGNEYHTGDKCKRTVTENEVTTVTGYICLADNTDTEWDRTHWEDQAGEMNFAEIIGNGRSSQSRSNARVLDWSGNERLKGDLYVHCNADSTGGTRVATMEDIAGLDLDDLYHICTANEYDVNTFVPIIQNPSSKKFYLVPNQNGSSPDLFTEWIYKNNAWEIFGSARIDISDKADKLDTVLLTTLSRGRIGLTTGVGSFAFGSDVEASGDYSHAEGTYTIASAWASHAEGYASRATGFTSHAEGYYTQASGEYSHVEGNGSIASGNQAHAEGLYTTASGHYSHSEGSYTVASAYNAHAEGSSNRATGSYSHAEGNSNEASGMSAHAEGNVTYASGNQAHAEGYHTIAAGENSHAEGYYTTAYGAYSHVFGAYNSHDYHTDIDLWESGHEYQEYDYARIVDSNGVEHLYQCHEPNSDTEFDPEKWSDNTYTLSGRKTKYVEVVGIGTSSSDEYRKNGRTLDWDGNETIAGKFKAKGIALGDYAFNTGTDTIAFGSGATASGYASLAQGYGSTASGSCSYAKGAGANASGSHALASGSGVIAEGVDSAAFGDGTKAIGNQSFAIGAATTANGFVQFVSGYGNVADIIPDYDNWDTWETGHSYSVGDTIKIDITYYSPNESYGTTGTYYFECIEANSDAEFDITKWKQYKYKQGKYIYIVGNGIFDPNINEIVPSNAYSLDWDGNGHFAGDVYVNCNPDGTGGTKLSSDVVQDVQINSISILENGVANIPIAGIGVHGVVKVEGAGVSVNAANGELFVTKATNDKIKAGTGDYTPIVPSTQHYSVFYGLSKIAGIDLKDNVNVIPGVNTYPDTSKQAIQKLIGLDGVLGTYQGGLSAVKAYSIGDTFIYNGQRYRATANIAINDIIAPDTNCVLSPLEGTYVKSTDIASANTPGLVKVNSPYGIMLNAGTLTIQSATSGLIKAGTNTFYPITSHLVKEAAFYGLAKAAGADMKDSLNPVGTYTDEAKVAIQEMLGLTMATEQDVMELIALYPKTWGVSV